MSAPLALTILPTSDLGTNVARLHSERGLLLLNPESSVDDQLAAIAGAVEYLRTGAMGRWRRPRPHLRPVASEGPATTSTVPGAGKNPPALCLVPGGAR